MNTERFEKAHYLIVIAAMVLTVTAWQFARSQVEHRSHDQFERSVQQTVELMAERMGRYDEALRAGVAVLRMAGNSVTHDEWRTFSSNLRIEERFPGINGIGIILAVPDDGIAAFVDEQRRGRPNFDVVPPTDTPMHFVITYIEPEQTNAAAVGLDLSFEANRLAAILQAGATGQSRMTAPITLVQDETETAGFLLLAPFFSDDDAESTRDVSAGHLGAVYAPFVVHRLMDGVLGRERRDILIQISDGGQIIYDEFDRDDPFLDPNPAHVASVQLQMFGRVWQVDVQSNLAFRSAHQTSQPTVILICGLMIDLVIFLLLLSLIQSNRRAAVLAEDLTAELLTDKRELEATNAALERYAHISSHDLRTPLRGMRDMSDYIVEDMADSHPDAAEDPQFIRNISQFNQLIERMEGLVEGMLRYSQLGQFSTSKESFDTQSEIVRLLPEFTIHSAAFSVSGDFPHVHCERALFVLIVSNLLHNAIQHHPDPHRARIHVSCTTKGTSLILRIRDNGVGIDPRYHDRIFDMFQTLNNSGTITTAGLGLAMVKRAISIIGGHITVNSNEGDGASFIIMLHGIVVDKQWKARAA